ncbi:unnamed protein product [Heterobilharzia americana]|nr:unnamed protein product [Heterobilharzia americana]
MLKNLCRQQIVINETLKSEISKLNNIIRVVSDERRSSYYLLLQNLIIYREKSSPDPFVLDICNNFISMLFKFMYMLSTTILDLLSRLLTLKKHKH